MVLKFTFINEKGEVQDDSDYFEDNKSDEELGPIFTREDIHTSTIDALRRYYGAQTMEQALRIF